MKKTIRKQMMHIRHMLEKTEKKARDKQIVSQIRQDQRYQKAQTVAIFYPMADEIDLLDLLNDNKTFLFPKVQNEHITFHPYNQQTRFVKSAFGVYEPLDQSVYNQQIDYMLVPALAMDQKGYRIGYGKGFYDRYIKSQRPKCTIGVIYTFQLMEHLDVNDDDQILDGYIDG